MLMCCIYTHIYVYIYSIHIQFIAVIGDTLKQKTAANVGNATYMSFMIDGDTDVSTKKCVIVYSRILRKGRPVNILIV